MRWELLKAIHSTVLNGKRIHCIMCLLLLLLLFRLHCFIILLRGNLKELYLTVEEIVGLSWPTRSLTDNPVYESEEIKITVDFDHTVDLYCAYNITVLGTYGCEISKDFEDNYLEYFYESGNSDLRYIPMGKCVDILKKELIKIKNK